MTLMRDPKLKDFPAIVADQINIATADKMTLCPDLWYCEKDVDPGEADMLEVNDVVTSAEQRFHRSLVDRKPL